MTDNQLIQLFLPIIQNQLIAYGYTGVITQQNNQPTQQGVNIAPTVYFYKVNDHRYGFLERIDVWDEVNQVMTHTEMQMYETKFNIGALVTQNPKNPNQYTASDLTNSVAAIMQSDYARNVMAASNVGILRVIDVVNPYFNDDRDQFEAFPSFDFVLTHSQTRVTTSPVVSSFEYDIYRV